MTTVIIILSITIALFVWGKYTPDIVALFSMLSLFLAGVLDLKETLSGFSNPTVIMIASLFIIGEGLSKTGWTALAGHKFVEWAGNSKSKLSMLVVLGSGILSGFVSNTGTVATLLPVTVAAAWNIGTVPSKLLMPVAFGSNTGGLLTLTGTPPNIIVSNALLENGYKGFSFFEFALIGVPLLLITIVYFRYFGDRILPKNTTKNTPINIDTEMHDWIENYSIDKDIYRLRIRSMSKLIDTKIEQWDFENNYNVSIVRLRRRHPNRFNGTRPFVEFPDNETELRYHDIITVKGKSADVDRLIIDCSLGIIPTKYSDKELKDEFINQEVGMAEMLVTPKSFFLGTTQPIGIYLKQLGIQLLATSRNSKPLTDKNVAIKAGDSFIIRGSWESIETLQQIQKGVVISGSPEKMAKEVDALTYKSYITLVMLLLMIVLLVFKIVPSAIAAMICAGVILITGCVPMAKAYKGISWISVVMIAAMIPMGIALQKTGVAALAANSLVTYLGSIHPILLLGGLFVLTTSFSQTINNSATAVLMAPIAILAATALDLSPKPFMITVAISASTAFLTPVGTTTNAMVMTAGDYKFMDYVKVGAPLLLLFFLITLLIIPLIWPF